MKGMSSGTRPKLSDRSRCQASDHLQKAGGAMSDPTCLQGSFASPGCKAEILKAERDDANKIAAAAKFEIDRLVAEVHKLRAACRGALKLPRPWLHPLSGHRGTLTFEEWDAAFSAI